MSRIDTFFLGFAVFVCGLTSSVGYPGYPALLATGATIMIYVALLPLSEYIVAKIAARRHRREGTPG